MACFVGAVLLTCSGSSSDEARAEPQPLPPRLPALNSVAPSSVIPTSVSPIVETALGIPRVSPPHSDDGVAVPQPLAPSEAARIAGIFRLQAHGAIAAAERETALLDTGSALDQAMLGHILADRYLGRFTKPDAEQLRDWLARWPSLADAGDIRGLLRQRSRSAGREATTSDDAAGATLARPKAAADVADADESPPNLDRSAELDQSVWTAARQRGGRGIRRLLANADGLSPRYRSQLLGEAGRILFTLGDNAAAYELASRGVSVCTRAKPSENCSVAAAAGMSAGLAAWRMGRLDLARPMFEAAWQARLTTTGQRAGAALWAARGALRAGNSAAQMAWLARAAQESGTFYGLLARRMLQLSRDAGQGAGSGQDTLSLADVDSVAATAAGAQALALLQVGQRTRAEAELRQLWPQMQAAPALTRAVMLVADHTQLYDLAAQLNDIIRDAESQGAPDHGVAGQSRRTAWFRIPDLRPEGGFRIDPALVFGLARTESNFDNASVSSVGASGIMQLMPETASFIVDGSADGRSHVAVSERRLRQMLADPSRNLALGQRYVVYLAGHSLVNGSLLHLLASYNCGPHKVAQWITSMADLNDPLLFMEAIPIDETRNYVARVLTYTWQYAARLRLPTPSLDELADGAWPQYHPLPAHYEAPAPLH